MTEVTIEEHVASVQGQIDAVTHLCGVLIAMHPHKQKIEAVIADLEANIARLAGTGDKKRVRYAQGMTNVLATFHRSLETAGLAAEVRDLTPNQKN